MFYIYNIIAVVVAVIAIFFTDLIAIEASDSVKTVIGLLMAMIFSTQAHVYDIKNRLKR